MSTDAYSYIEKLVAQKRYAQARLAIKKELKKHPRDLALLKMLADIYFDERKDLEALKVAKKIYCLI
jgi:uncharacterized protein HemY